ncbi:alpha/beta fold hydrolase [Nocardioides dubius]|uniref:AB hydrolase-1 domain-containing protein n=1 Tax=Nocardioides dubius TaxID=317019 RepID=A0ABP4ELS9_9ACTN
MATFVLVHGAFRGGWGWARVRPLLRAAGHEVHAPSLIGAGEHAALLDRVTGLDVWVDQVAGLIEAEDLRDVALVGHSQGGLVTAGVAARLPERIAVLVHLDAAVPLPRERAVDLGGAPSALPARDAVVAPTPVGAQGGYDAATAAWVNARLTPSPVAPALDPVPGVPASVSQAFVFCSGTPAGYPSTQVRARLDAQGTPYLLIDAAHDAPLCAPELVTSVLTDCVA